MTGRMHLGLAFGAALALHGGALALWAPSGEHGGGGPGGAARVTLAASAGAAAMVNAWERAPAAQNRAVVQASAPLETEVPSAEVLHDQGPPMVAPPARPRAARADALPVAGPDAPRRSDVPIAAVAAALAPLPQADESLAPGLVAPDRLAALRSAPDKIDQPTVAALPRIAAEAPVDVLRPSAADTRPRPRPSPGAEARAATVAAGDGAAHRSGQGGTPSTQADTSRAKASLMARWGAEIRNRVERRKSYPAAAGGASGKTVLQLSVNAGGRLTAVGVVQSSGVAAIDRAAIGAVRRAGRFPAAPGGLGPGPHAFRLSLAFRG
ncbi:MAG: TonB family protein [Pseudomonadota bacterium]